MLHLKPPLAFDLSSGQLKKKKRDQKSLVTIEKKKLQHFIAQSNDVK